MTVAIMAGKGGLPYLPGLTNTTCSQRHKNIWEGEIGVEYNEKDLEN
jgi:hypothetical protein